MLDAGPARARRADIFRCEREPEGWFLRHILMTNTQPQPQGTNQPGDQTAQFETAAALQSPSHLIASIPGALGYFPNEAVILVSLYARPGEPGALDVGAYLDADLGSTTSIQRALQRVPASNHVATFAVIVTRVPHSDMVAAAAAGLHQAADEFGELVEACWIVSEIADGTHYQLVFGPDAEIFDSWGWDAGYHCGTVASVAASAAMRPLITHGVLPELHRDDAFRHFDPVSDADVAMSEAIAPEAYRRGAELLELTQSAPWLALPQMKAASNVFLAAPNVKLIDSEGSLILDDVFASAADVELVAAMLTRNMLRDCLIEHALDHPGAASAVLVSVARNFSGRIRANALCLWAMVAVSQQLHGWASVALMCADDEVPAHSLAGLLANVLGVGQAGALIELSRRGCRDTWREVERRAAAQADG